LGFQLWFEGGKRVRDRGGGPATDFNKCGVQIMKGRKFGEECHRGAIQRPVLPLDFVGISIWALSGECFNGFQPQRRRKLREDSRKTLQGLG
jgi:hypothetical protein